MLNSYIKTFFEVVDSGSFSAASEELFLSKVSVMNQINTLENTVGVPLLKRTNRGVTLTEAGQSFYRNARKIQNLSEAALEEARKIGGKNNRVIRIGTSMMRPCNKLVELWERTKSQHLQFNIVPFNDDIDSLNILLNSLAKKIDCFVTPCGSMKILMNYNFLPFSTCKYEIAMSKRHRLAKKETLQWTDLYGESLLLVNRGESYIVDEIRDEIARFHTEIRVVPRCLTAYSMLPRVVPSIVLPAFLITNNFLIPAENIASGITRESEQVIITAYGDWPSATVFSLISDETFTRAVLVVRYFP